MDSDYLMRERFTPVAICGSRLVLSAPIGVKILLDDFLLTPYLTAQSLLSVRSRFWTHRVGASCPVLRFCF